MGAMGGYAAHSTQFISPLPRTGEGQGVGVSYKRSGLQAGIERPPEDRQLDYGACFDKA